MCVGAEHQAGHRDANLARGDVAVEQFGLFEDRRQPRGKGIAALGALLDAASADADGRELSGDVDGVDENQRRGDEDGNPLRARRGVATAPATIRQRPSLNVQLPR